jgi:hypothetical protein
MFSPLRNPAIMHKNIPKKTYNIFDFWSDNCSDINTNIDAINKAHNVINIIFLV